MATWNMERILKAARHHGASDIHLVQDIAPLLRVNGDIRACDGEPLTVETLHSLFAEMVNERQREIFAKEMQLSMSRTWAGLGRFRTSCHLHCGCPEMAIRLCETVVRPMEELGLPELIRELTRLPNGLVLITGATGMGKTTTMNDMIDSINRDRRCKIVTIEDPVEFVHENLRSIVIQQEVLTTRLPFGKRWSTCCAKTPMSWQSARCATWRRSKPL